MVFIGSHTLERLLKLLIIRGCEWPSKFLFFETILRVPRQLTELRIY